MNGREQRQKIVMKFESPVEFGSKRKPFTLVIQSDEPQPVFVSAFMNVVNRIPKRDRYTIIDYWQNANPTDTLGMNYVPDIMVATFSGIDGKSSQDTHGHIDRKGRRIVFNKLTILDMPDCVLRELIAHELAHAYQAAAGMKYYGPDEESEVEAYNIEACWGFDVHRVVKWYASRTQEPVSR